MCLSSYAYSVIHQKQKNQLLCERRLFHLTGIQQFRDGKCQVRILWDQAVAEAMGWDPEQLARLRELLSNEPHARGLGYNQYADDIEDIEGMGACPDEETAGED